ncbi:MAG TPA: hypothetical protein VEW48_25200 [Thermoanaerobaculia bacterium]|nr:hypothetical protein [Thermoanaerobaculia bacterium]
MARTSSQKNPPLDEQGSGGVATVSDRQEEELRSLAEQWRRSRNPVKGTAAALAMHPAYQRIIGKGPAALPFILRELQREPDHWFWALTAITGLDPVPESDRGHLKKMADAWISWGKKNRII